MFRQSWYLRCYKKVNTSKNSTIVQLKNIDASVLLINSSLISCKGHAIAVRRRSSSNEWLKIRARSNFLLHRLFLLHLLVFTASVQMLKLLLLNAGLDHISIRIALVLDQMIMLLMKKRILCYCICESNTPSLCENEEELTAGRWHLTVSKWKTISGLLRPSGRHLRIGAMRMWIIMT